MKIMVYDFEKLAYQTVVEAKDIRVILDNGDELDLYQKSGWKAGVLSISSPRQGLFIRPVASNIIEISEVF